MDIISSIFRIRNVALLIITLSIFPLSRGVQLSLVAEYQYEEITEGSRISCGFPKTILPLLILDTACLRRTKTGVTYMEDQTMKHYPVLK